MVLLDIILGDTALNSVGFQRAGLWLFAGFVLLGWTLARMSIKRRKKTNHRDSETQEIQRNLSHTKVSAVPLSDAPPETQRWQVAMFDLQRELTGELDSRIAITQALLRQVDARIEMLRALEQERRSSIRDQPG